MMGYEEMSTTQVTYYTIAVVFLVFASGGTAGLQIALFSIDRLLLRVQSTAGTPVEQKRAKKLLAVLDLGHWTLVALILLNASCMMTLPILLERLVGDLLALIISISAVLFLGEVVPLALFIQNAISICAFLVPVVWFAIIVFAPIGYPVGKWLDHFLGRHEEMLDRTELAAVILSPMMGENGEMPSTSEEMDVVDSNIQSGADHHALQDWEVGMLQGAMSLTTDTISEHISVELKDCFMLSSLTPLDKTVIQTILDSGYSRIPVYYANTPAQVVGVLIVNSLVRLCFHRPDPPPLVGDYPLHGVLRLSETTTLHTAYLAFRRGCFNMAVVYNIYGQTRGIITYSEILYKIYRFDMTHSIIRIPSSNLPRRQNKIINFVEDIKNSKQKQVLPSVIQMRSELDLQVDNEQPNEGDLAATAVSPLTRKANTREF